ncbi:transposase [Scytonema hofmannii FACHB-248]|uniref:Transposase n=1 Tax=Scytonema hofmannii FACHB-248 TaxID=1842502 RepID=A0ABR8GJD6_9CYAN|nr:transposase [Scytonema hofmannii FACHB-248]
MKLSKTALECKTKKFTSVVIFAVRFYPLSKNWSICTHIQNMPFKVRTFECGNWVVSVDRDLNAPKNLEKLGSKNADG